MRKRTIFCKHFNGMRNDTCRAGIEYLSLGVRGGLEYPCLKRARDPEGTPRVKCSKCEYPTQAELDAEAAESAARFEKNVTARAAIVAHAKDHPEDNTIPCPACKTGVLCYAVHSNGHIHAKCSTDGCVCWME
jgi:hypothetical protein